MKMVVHVGGSVLVQLGIDHAEGDNLSFIVDGERPSEYGSDW
jgi:hypothetical protein